MEKLVTAVNGLSAAAGIVMAALLGFTIPGIWTLQSDFGSVKTTLASLDKKADAVETKVDAITKRADSIELHLVARESDPAALVAQSGLRPATQFGGIRVGNKIIALPKSDEAAAELVKAGLQREAVTPSAWGYVLGTIGDDGRWRAATVTVGPMPKPEPGPASIPPVKPTLDRLTVPN